MAGTKLQAAERPIGEIFTDAYRFSIPRYQRPYAWTPEEAGEMLDDLFDASSTRAPDGEAEPYFLGSVVLVKAEGKADSEVVDGQQRLTTLTILLAALRERFDSVATDIHKRIYQEGDVIKRIVARPRLCLRERDARFFEQYVQKRGGIARLAELERNRLPDAQRNLAANAELFASRFASRSDDELMRLLRFIDQHTYLVIVATQDFDSAYRIFTVLNERGLDLTHTDILKSEIIGRLPNSDQDLYTKKWENIEEDLGREDFATLFSHIRMVYAKTKAKEAIIKEFREAVMRKVPDSVRLIEEVVEPLADAYEVISKGAHEAAEGAEGVNRVLRWLRRLDNRDWVPPAISYYSRYASHTSDLRRFLTDLERLAASMLIRRIDITRRVERYGRVLQAIEEHDDLWVEESPLQLSAAEQRDTLLKLTDEIYTVTRIRGYVMLRLDAAVSAGGVDHEHSVITVEHVLPQNPSEDSQWRILFTDEQRDYWTHRLANLLLLTHVKNSQAGNLDFDLKKERYFAPKGGVSPFAVTAGVLSEAAWTPEVLERRQRDLLTSLAKLWRLQAADA